MYTRVSTTSSPPATLIARSYYIILPTMPLSEDIVTSRHRFTSYGPASVTINEVVYRQSLVLTANDIYSPWAVSSIEDLNPENLAPVLESKPAVVLLGTGEQQRFPDARTFALFGERGIGLEVMDNGALCRTFNILVAEDRAVTAAVILST